MCGEHQNLLVHVSTRPGIIPACAGSTAVLYNAAAETLGSSPHVRGALSSGRRPSTPARDHPRMCGEHRQGPLHLLPALGIIPACAGSTRERFKAENDRKGSSPHVRGALEAVGPDAELIGDHPRMCGEHPAVTASEVPAGGSSPHVRGAPCGRPGSPGR